MAILLFDDHARNDLLPFTHTRPVADIRCGIRTMRERWEHHLSVSNTATLTETHLRSVYPPVFSEDNLWINGAIFADRQLAESIQALQPGQKLIQGDSLIALRSGPVNSAPNHIEDIASTLTETIHYDADILRLRYIWDIFSLNDKALRADFTDITLGRKSQPIPEQVIVTGRENIFLEEGAVIQAGVVINASTGPVYIGAGAEILEGCLLRGPVALNEQAVLKMGAKVYGATTLGPGCKVGGEISNVVFFAYSNKGHDGFLGNAVIGAWCNLGADTNCSNLKNNYGNVAVWHEHSGKSLPTGLQFCGLLMADHSKCGINTMFNTGTVVGVSANIYGSGFPDKFIPSFSWGGSEGMVMYDFEKAMETAQKMMERRGLILSEAEKALYWQVYTQTAAQRKGYVLNS